VGRNAKVGIAGAVVLILAVITLFMDGMSPIVPIAIVVIGGAGIFFLLRQDDDDYDDDDDGGSAKARSKTKAKKGKARLDEILDDKAKSTGTGTTRRAPAPATPPGGGLPTWSPGSVDSGAADDLIASDDLDSGSDANWDSWEKEWPQGDTDSLVLDDDDPLSSLDRLDDIDPVAEVERIEAETDDDPFASLRADISVDDTFELDELDDFAVELDDEPAPAASSGSGFSFASAPAVINEEVSTADDIMAASTATELHVEDAGDSELARLLAKVQARLSAYE
jgi:hypothetical protein